MAFVPMQAVRDRLNLTDTTDEAEVGRVLDAACEWVENYCGPMTVRTYSEVVRPGRRAVLRHVPVVSVLSVAGAYGSLATYDPTVFYVDGATGEMSPAWGNRLPTAATIVTYTAGRSTVPGPVVQATLELVAHAWETQRGALPGPGTASWDTGGQAHRPEPGFAIPNRVLEWLAPYRNVVLA